jgi:endonuclease/exonuclease/phosphatase family metal-dependent hydrolase
MRLISLNVWKGKLLDPLLAFIAREAPTTDIFCFQEMVYPDIFNHCEAALPDFRGFFEVSQNLHNNEEFGLAMFVRRTDPVEREGDVFVYRTRNAEIGDDGRTIGRNLQFITFPKSGIEYTIANFHGLWSGESREDTPDRISQSKHVRKFLDGTRGRKIICGDFNLTRDTQSLTIIDDGMKNLIKENDITSTRNERYFPYADKYCDYIVVDNDVLVKNFSVLEDDVSDHYALAMEFE